MWPLLSAKLDTDHKTAAAATTKHTRDITFLNYIVTCTPLMRRVLVRMIGFIIRWVHTHS
jgi:hypothetical protein